MLNNPKVKFVKISRRHFDIITPKDNNTIYFIEENSGEITLNLGDTQITVGRFSNEELLELIEGKQESKPNGEDLLIIDGKINPLYIDYIENDIDSIKLKDIEQDNRLDIIESDIEDIEGLIKIDDETITRNTNQELEVSDLVLNDINSRVKEKDFTNYQTMVQNFLNGKLDKKPDGVIDLINAFNKIDARYLDIDNELFVVALELPEIRTGNKIYLVPKTGTDNNNEYDEYIYINDKWEALGTITIDLSNYYDKNEINTLLEDFVKEIDYINIQNQDTSEMQKLRLYVVGGQIGYEIGGE